MSNDGLAEIARLVPKQSGVLVTATGWHANGIARIGFVLIDLAGDSRSNVVDRKDVDYAKPPTEVAEEWVSRETLAAERSYRLLFHVYDTTGVNLVAYDRRDFAVQEDVSAT